MNDKVSIIIPVYNAESTIERCVVSLLQGEYSNIEIILVDDDSVDASWEICERLEKSNNQVIAVRNKWNRGVSFTRNAGLKLASGKYLMFVDSDDWVEKNFVNKMVETMNTNDIQLAIMGYVNHDEIHNGRLDYFKWNSFDKVKLIQLKQKILELYDQRMLQQLWNKIFLLDIINQNSIVFDETISMGEDFRFVLAYLSAIENYNTALINQTMYHYIRDNANSLMSKFGEEKIDEPIKNINDMIELLDTSSDEKEKLKYTEKQKIINQYSYRIMHNKSMSLLSRILAVKKINSDSGLKNVIYHVVLLCKETIKSICPLDFSFINRRI